MLKSEGGYVCESHS